MKKFYHSICRWTFNAGKGGFVPGDKRGTWSAEKLDTVGVIDIIQKEIMPKIPDEIRLGYEVHYGSEVTDHNAAALADKLNDAKMALAMITPGAHSRFGYGGICSVDPQQREAADELGRKTVDTAYGPLKKTWDHKALPSLVIWNGSFGYDLAGVHVYEMYQNMKQSIANLYQYEQSRGGQLYWAIEPKPNEGHPAMLLPTVASVIALWYKIEKEYGVSIEKAGVNKEFGHSEMIGLDLIYDTVEEIEHNALKHMHLNSQGYNDGITLGGPGKYDIDNTVRINGFNITIAALARNAGYNRWKGHDIQPRPYDNEQQAADRVVRSILSWHACEKAADEFDQKAFLDLMKTRKTAAAEDMMRHAVVNAHKHFDKMYGSAISS